MRTVSILNLIFALGSSSLAFADSTAKTVNVTPTDDVLHLLPSIRRIAIDLPKTNSTEFRSFMSSSESEISGFLALPLTEEQMNESLMKTVESVSQSTGRFWSISVDSTLDFLNSNDKSTSFATRLSKQYDLDAWLVPEVIFQPDHTLVRVSLRSTGLQKTIAREDVTLVASPSLNEIKSGFQNAIARLTSTLGHDGKVSYFRDDLMTLDFGLERGLASGQKLKAGVVLLSAFHPQTGEFLRAKRVATYELEVIESRQGSTLARVVAHDRVASTEIANRLKREASELPLLAWRPDPKKSETTWQDALDTAAITHSGASESGFGALRSNPPLQKEQKVATSAPETAAAKHSEPVAPTNIVQREASGESIERNVDGNGQLEEADSAHSTHEEFYPHHVNVGLGAVYGTLSSLPKKVGASTQLTETRSSGISPGLFANAIFEYEGWEIEPALEYMLFTTAEVTAVSGSFASLEVLGQTKVYEFTPGVDALYAGGSVEYTFGTVKTALLKNEANNTSGTRSLSHAGAAIHATYSRKLPGLLSAKALMGITVPDFGVKFYAYATNIVALPKELSFFLMFKTIQAKNWDVMGLGVQWDVLPKN